jgi:hypothetical protein
VKDEAGHGRPSARSTLVSMSSRNGGCVEHSGAFPLLLGGLAFDLGVGLFVVAGAWLCIYIYIYIFFFFCTVRGMRYE